MVILRDFPSDIGILWVGIIVTPDQSEVFKALLLELWMFFVRTILRIPNVAGIHRVLFDQGESHYSVMYTYSANG